MRSDSCLRGRAQLLATAVAAGAVLAGANPAAAQRVNENAAGSAEDAFGSSIGNERVGLYTPNNVRGFSPEIANNIRIEGLYIDRPGNFTDRLIQSDAVRVGLTAQDYLLPAPTGIVDFRIRPAGNDLMVSSVAELNSWGGGRLEIDTQIPLIEDRLSIAAGASGFLMQAPAGQSSIAGSYALTAHITPAEGIRLIPFWSRIDIFDREPAPLYTPAPGTLPPQVQRRLFPGPDWADERVITENFGTIAKVNVIPGWELASGLFRSSTFQPTRFAQNFIAIEDGGESAGLEPTGIRRINSDPRQQLAATSGEVRLSRQIDEGPRRHTVYASLRGRQRGNFYGGGAQIELDRAPLEAELAGLPPEFTFGQQTDERVEQWLGGIAYLGRWAGVGSLGLGMQRTWYRKRVDRPGDPLALTATDTWLPNATLSAELSETLALYASYSRGLEESGLAPDSALNRGDALSAILTSQVDAGLRWRVVPGVSLVAGLFDLRKPYFAADPANVFRELGDVRHRGAEISFTGNVAKGLTLVAGAVLMDPEVTGEGVTQGRVGPRPLNQPARLLTLATQYAIPGNEDLVLTFNTTHRSSRPADTLNLVSLPPRTILDVGFRLLLDLAGSPALLRVQLENLTNAYDWELVGSGSFRVNAPRRLAAFLTVDY